MKLIIRKTADGKIMSVNSLDHYIKAGKTEQEVNDAIASSNENQGFQMYSMIEVDGIIAETFKLLLGDDEYYQARTITSIYGKLRDLYESMESISNDLYDMSDSVHSTLKEVRELIPDEED